MTFQLITLVTCTLGMGLVGLVYNSPAVYFMVAALVSLLLVSYAGSRLSARAIAWRRDNADRVFEHEPMRVMAELTNQGRLPRFLLTVIDRLPEFVYSDHPPEFVLPALWPGEKVRLSYQARAQKRGVYALGPLRISVSDPFGVFQHFVPMAAQAEAVVYPRPVPLTGLVARTGGEPGLSTGERARASQSGLEFYGIRDYQPGDELRRIHWPATAHHRQLTVIEYERGISRTLAVVLDTRAGSEFGAGVDTTLEVGVRVAASLVHWALESQGTAFLALDAGGGPRWLEIERADREYEALEVLARVSAAGTTPVSTLLDWAGRHLMPGATACAVTALPDAHLPASVALLRRQQVRVAAVLIDAQSFDLRAADLTVGGALETAGAAVAVVKRGDDLGEALKGALIEVE